MAHPWALPQQELASHLLQMYSTVSKEIVLPNGDPKVTSFRIPSLAQPSIYHEPIKISSLALTESALSKYGNYESEVWTGGPFEQHDVINIQNRDSVLTLLLQFYNADIGNLSVWSRDAFCKSCLRLAGSGFKQFTERIHSNCTSGARHRHTRISVTSGLLVEMLSGIYFCMFNGHMKIATIALEAIHSRACYELFSDVQLVSNAILNSLTTCGEGKVTNAIVNSLTTCNEGQSMGLCVSDVDPSCTSVNKSALTNASFRARKLPDDINIPEGTPPAKSLPVIDEKQAETTQASPSPKPPKNKIVKNVARKVERLRPKRAESVSNGTDSVDALTVVVNKKHTKTTVDNIDLVNMNTNQSVDEADSDSLRKTRSSSLTSSQPITRHITSRYSSHSINPTSTHTQI